MSGEAPVVALGAGVRSPVARLLAALDKVLVSLPRRAVLIGGVAVAARLGTVERATGDVDAVVDAPDDPGSIELLLEKGVAVTRISETSALVDDVKVDLIDTFRVSGETFADAAGPDDHFVAAHRFGFETASPMRLVVTGGPEVPTLVADPAGLVAMKLHAALWRRDRERKLPGDLYDLYRLLDVFDTAGELSSVIGSRPNLNRLCLAAAETVFVERLTANAGVMSRSDDSVIASITRDDLADVGGPFVERLRRAVSPC